MSTSEAYNFSKAGFMSSNSYIRPIDPSEAVPKGLHRQRTPKHLGGKQIYYSIKRKPSSFEVLQGNKGRTLITVKRPSIFSKGAKMNLEHSNQEIELKRPKGSWSYSARAFEFENIQYKWEFLHGNAKLYNDNSRQLIADFYNHSAKWSSQCNLVVYNPNYLNSVLKMLVIASCFELYLEHEARTHVILAGSG